MSDFKVTLQYRVPYADTDQMGYVYYANYFIYFERGRNELMRAMNFTYKELEDMGIGLPVIEAHSNYRSPARYDDLLTVEARSVRAGPGRTAAVRIVPAGPHPQHHHPHGRF